MLLLAQNPHNGVWLTLVHTCTHFAQLHLINVFFFALSNSYFTSAQAKYGYPLLFFIQALTLFCVPSIFSFFSDTSVRYFFLGTLTFISIPIILYLIILLNEIPQAQSWEHKKHESALLPQHLIHLSYMVLFLISLSIAQNLLSHLFDALTNEAYRDPENRALFRVGLIEMSYKATATSIMLGIFLFIWKGWRTLASLLPMVFLMAGTIGHYFYTEPHLLNDWFALSLSEIRVQHSLITFFECISLALTPLCFSMTKEISYIFLPLPLRTQSKLYIDTFIPILVINFMYTLIIPTLGIYNSYPWHIMAICGGLAWLAVWRMGKLTSNVASQRT